MPSGTEHNKLRWIYEKLLDVLCPKNGKYDDILCRETMEKSFENKFKML